MEPDLIKTSPEEKLTKMANDAKEASSISGGFMEPGTKKRGRPKGSKFKSGAPEDGGARTSQSYNGAEKAPGGGPSVDHTADLMPLVKPLWQIADRTAVQYAGDERAAIGSDRLQILTQTTAQCLNQYLPDILGKHAPLCVLLVTVMQWGVVIYQVRTDNINKMKNERNAGNSTQPSKSPMGEANLN